MSSSDHLTQMAIAEGLTGLEVWFANDCPDICSEFKDLLQYWHELTADNIMPARHQLAPKKIVSHLPYVGLFDIIRDDTGGIGDIMTRLEGTELAGFYGDITGKSINDLPSAQVVERVKFYARVLDKYKKPIIANIDMVRSDRPLVSARGLYIPLAEDGVTMDKVFICSHLIA